MFGRVGFLKTILFVAAIFGFNASASAPANAFPAQFFIVKQCTFSESCIATILTVPEKRSFQLQNVACHFSADANGDLIEARILLRRGGITLGWDFLAAVSLGNDGVRDRYNSNDQTGLLAAAGETIQIFIQQSVSSFSRVDCKIFGDYQVLP